jgi:thiamine biosynthesis lipoprotein ApbE
MSLAVAIQMDPIETVNIDADSSFVLGLEAGMRLVDSQPSVDAVVIDREGTLHYSRGLRQAAGAQSGAPA